MGYRPSGRVCVFRVKGWQNRRWRLLDSLRPSGRTLGAEIPTLRSSGCHIVAGCIWRAVRAAVRLQRGGWVYILFLLGPVSHGTACASSLAPRRTCIGYRRLLFLRCPPPYRAPAIRSYLILPASQLPNVTVVLDSTRCVPMFLLEAQNQPQQPITDNKGGVPRSWSALVE